MACNFSSTGMTKTADLVNEMLAEAKGAWLIAIAVAFDTETKFVFSTERRPLEALNQLIKNGGSPIGLLKFIKVDGSVQGSYRPFEEYSGAPWVKEYFEGLLANAREIVELSRAGPAFPTAY